MKLSGLRGKLLSYFFAPFCETLAHTHTLTPSRRVRDTALNGATLSPNLDCNSTWCVCGELWRIIIAIIFRLLHCCRIVMRWRRYVAIRKEKQKHYTTWKEKKDEEEKQHITIIIDNCGLFAGTAGKSGSTMIMMCVCAWYSFGHDNPEKNDVWIKSW